MANPSPNARERFGDAGARPEGAVRGSTVPFVTGVGEAKLQRLRRDEKLDRDDPLDMFEDGSRVARGRACPRRVPAYAEK